jgi:hypothetical protein
LIKVTGIPHRDFAEILSSFDNAKNYGDNLQRSAFYTLEAELIGRIDQNYDDYVTALAGFGTRELIDMVDKIKAMSDAHDYMTVGHGYDADELRFYLQFTNPLEIVANEWSERNKNIDDMMFVMDYIGDERESFLNDYPLLSDEPNRTPQAPAERGESKQPLTPIEQLYEKMSDEYRAFIDSLKSLPPTKIIEASYEKVMKEDLLLSIENGGFEEAVIGALLTLDCPLKEIYQQWLDTDDTYMGLLRDCIDLTAANLIIAEAREGMKKAEMKQEPQQETVLKQPKKPQKKPSLLGELSETKKQLAANKSEKTAEPNVAKKHKKEEID